MTVAPPRIHVFGHHRKLRHCPSPDRTFLRIDLGLDNPGKVRPLFKKATAHRVAMVDEFRWRKLFDARDRYTALEKHPRLVWPRQLRKSLVQSCKHSPKRNLCWQPAR